MLERFLFRLSISPHRERLVLKGGMLLAVFEERRATPRCRLLARGVSNELDEVAASLAKSSRSTSMMAWPSKPTGLTREHPRRRNSMRAYALWCRHKSTAPNTRLHLDVNVGDPVTPAPVEVEYPALLAEPFTVVGYPIETVLAEKIVTMIDAVISSGKERFRRRCIAYEGARHRSWHVAHGD